MVLAWTRSPDSGAQSLPMGLGYAEGYTHDYVRHGTTTLFAALDIATDRCSGSAGSGTATRSSCRSCA